MKKLLLLLQFPFYLMDSASAQDSLVKQWDYRFGGTQIDHLTCFQQTADGGYILGGYSSSGINGDKTQATQGGVLDYDYWIIKIDSMGNKQWDKDFGGTTYDYLYSLQQTTDGGYILGGASHSGIGGDKTQPTWDTSSIFNSSGDYWIVKIDSLGNTQWDKDFGGTDYDLLSSMQQTTDGGYILGGYSYSGIGGDKTQANWDTVFHSPDYWIVKTDSLGNKQWDKDFGGTDIDLLSSLQQTNDGGYMLGGTSISGNNGDKTQVNWGNSWDYWIIKTDSLGIKQWDKDLGGTNYDWLFSLQQTSDNGYILGGTAASGISGDKTQPSWGQSDYWIVKTDSLGIKQWDKDFGGSVEEDFFGKVSQTTDKGYFVTGSSDSNISGDKTEDNLGPIQTWLVKTDSLGNKQWDKTIFTLAIDEESYGIQTKDGCYAMVNFTNSGIGGYKTQPNWNANNVPPDYWIIKFCDSTYSTEGIENIHSTVSVTIMPNPFTSEISITIAKKNSKNVSFVVKNILGQIIFSKQEDNFNSTITKTIDLNFLSSGMYFLEVIIDGERTVKKIVKE